MRIDRVDIRHFAGLSNISISFEQPFSLQYGKNETGKTTVMRFIRMMLYGSSALRLSCKPLSGEPMSGSLIFTQDSRHYQLDRVFGKSRRTDSITLTDLDTGTEQNLGSAEPGEMFLNLSEDTFVRSCFVGSLGSISGEKGSEEIRQRLQNLVSSGAEAVSVSEVEKRLAAAARTIQNKSGTQGLLVEKEAELNTLRHEYAETKLLEQSRRDTAERYAVLKKEGHALAHALQIAAQESESNRRAKTEALYAKISKLQKRLAPNGVVPERSTLTGYQRQITLLTQADTAQHVDITALTAQMQNRIEAANAARQRHVLLKQEQIHANAHKQETKERFDRYRYRHLKQRSIWLLPLGGIFLLLSIPLFRFHFSLWGSVACGLGLLTLLFGVFLLVTYRKKHARMETEYADAIRKEEIASAALAEHQLTLDTCESTLNDITLQLKQSIGKKQQNDEIIRRKEELMRTLAPYGLSDWQDAGRLVESLIADFDAYNMSQAKLTAISQAAPSEKEQTLRQKLHAVQIEYARLDGILQTGAPPQSASQLENRIRDAEQEQQALQMKLKALREASEVLAESFAEMQQEFGAILSRETAQNLNRLTGGRYNYVTIDRSLNLKTRLPDSGAITADKLLSNGTIDQAYLALRLAITKLIAMQTGKSLPLFFDDSFIQYDDTRCEYAFRLVEELLDEPEFSQAVLFTCHSREARLTGEDMRG